MRPETRQADAEQGEDTLFGRFVLRQGTGQILAHSPVPEIEYLPPCLYQPLASQDILPPLQYASAGCLRETSASAGDLEDGIRQGE